MTDLVACDSQKKWKKELLSVLRLRHLLSRAAPQNDVDSNATLLADCITHAHDEMKESVCVLMTKIAKYRPRIVCFLAKSVWEVFI